MLKTLTSTALLAGTFLMALAPDVALARDHGREGRHDFGRSERGYRGGRGFSGGGYYYGDRNFVSPRRFDRGRGNIYVAPRSYGRPFYRGYSGGAYFGYSAPYGYYTPGYVYTAPVPQPQSCVEGTYDRYGNWVANPNCYQTQPQYQQQQQQGYDSYPQPYEQQDQRQYQQPQQDYRYDQQQYQQPPQQQDYDQNRQQYPQPYDR